MPVVAVLAVQAQARDPGPGGGFALLEVGHPFAAALRALDASDEARHDGLHRAEQHAAVVTRLGQRVCHQVEDQLLVGLAGREHAHVRQRGSRKQPAQQVERLRLDGTRMRGRRAAVGRGVGRLDPGHDLRQRGGVDAEDLVHRLLVLRAEVAVAVIAITAAGHRGVVGDVARRLLEVGAHTRPLEDLCQDVGDPLAGDVRAAQLGDGVVAVADEDALVELGRPPALVAVP